MADGDDKKGGRMRWHGAWHLAGVLVLAILLKLPLANCVCVDVPESDTPEWQMLIEDDGQPYTGRSMAEAADGDLYVAGSTPGPLLDSRIFVMRRTAEGASKWVSHAPVETAYEDGIRLASHPEGGVVLFYNTGAIQELATPSRYHLVRFDDAGEIVWARQFGGTGNNDAVDVVVLDDGYGLLGTTDAVGFGGRDFELIRTNTEGVVRWSKTYGGAADDWAADLEATADGGFALLGTSASMTSAYADLFLVKVDASGREQWNKNFGITPENHAGGLVQTEDGGYLLAGDAIFRDLNILSSRFDDQPYLVKTDATGKLSWERLVDRNQRFQIRGVIEVDGGGYALTGSVADFTDEYQAPCYTALLMEVTTEGGYIRSGGYGAYNGTEGYQAIQAQDGSFVLVGTSSTFDESDSYLRNLAYLAKVSSALE